MRLELAPLLAWLPGAVALGQAQGVGHWISEVTTQDGDSIVEPGETATVSLWMDMDPSVGEMLPDGTKVAGFAGGYFDLLGGPGAEKGLIVGWEPNEALYQDVDGTTDGLSIFDVYLFQFLTFEIDTSDPIYLMSFEWQPIEYLEFEATYTPFVDFPEFMEIGVAIYKIDGQQGFTEFWPTSDYDITITVIPVPGGALMLFTGVALRRTRRPTR